MKFRRNRLRLLMLSALLAFLPAWARAQIYTQNIYAGAYTFTDYNDYFTVFTYNGGDSVVSIPGEFFSKPVVGIEESAFYGHSNLTIVTVPNSITNIGGGAFANCTNLTGVYFERNAPGIGDSSSFTNSPNVTVYYLPGTTGWETTFAERPTAPWFLPNPTILNFEPDFGVQTNAFGFTISWATNTAVVVEACTNLVNPDWQPVQTNVLTDGSAYFSDPQWTNYPGRFYRLRSP